MQTNTSLIPDMTDVHENRFKSVIGARFVKSGYNTRSKEDFAIRKSMANLYWRLYSSGMFSFSSFTPLSYADVVELEWVSDELTAQALLTGLCYKGYGALLERVERDGDSYKHGESYRLNFRYAPSKKTWGKGVAETRAKKRDERRKGEKFKYLAPSQILIIDTTSPKVKEKYLEKGVKHTSKQLLDHLIHYKMINADTFTPYPIKKLVGKILTHLDANKGRGIGSFSAVRTSLSHLSECGLIERYNKTSRGVYNYKLTFTPPEVVDVTVVTAPVAPLGSISAQVEAALITLEALKQQLQSIQLRKI